MPYARLARILNRAIGLDAASIGAPALAGAVRGRIAARGLSGPDAYAAEVEANADELRALIEAVVVPETWFMRDREAFGAVAEFARQRVADPLWAGKLRLISVPCSTGEEPYSLAMTLLDAGLPASAFEIHAFDVSHAALERARAGVYGRNSFRGADLGFRARYFTETPAGWRIQPDVAASVRFAQANLLEIGSAILPASYDVVFCRNLLIYFDADTQQRAIGALGDLLRPGGHVFVGPGEANLMLGAGFASVQRPLTFCFRRGVREGAAEPAAQRPLAAPPKLAKQAQPAKAAVAPPPFAKALAAPAESRPAAGASLAEAQRLADLGRIEEARAVCDGHLRQAPDSAPAWRLLGVLSEAGQDPSRAADCYRRALYLDPGDAETLGHLALLLQRQGDHAGAGRVRERARRRAAAERGL